LAGALYGSIFQRTVPVSSPAAAEMTKLLEKYLSLCKHRSGQRVEAALPAQWGWTSGK